MIQNFLRKHFSTQNRLEAHKIHEICSLLRHNSLQTIHSNNLFAICQDDEEGVVGWLCFSDLQTNKQL